MRTQIAAAMTILGLTGVGFAQPGENETTPTDATTATETDTATGAGEASASKQFEAPEARQAWERYRKNRSEALEKYRQVMKRMQLVRDRQLSQARTQVLNQLQAAQDAATKRADLEAALQIKRRIQQVQNNPTAGPAAAERGKLDRQIKRLRLAQDRATRKGNLERALRYKKQRQRLETQARTSSPSRMKAETEDLRRHLLKLKVDDRGTTVEADLDKALGYVESIAKLVDQFSSDYESDRTDAESTERLGLESQRPREGWGSSTVEGSTRTRPGRDARESDAGDSDAAGPKLNSTPAPKPTPIKVDPAGKWTMRIPHLDVTHQVTLTRIAPNRYIMNPSSLVGGGEYRLKDDRLIYSNPGDDPNFDKMVWKAVTRDRLIEVGSKDYAGNILERRSSEGPSPGDEPTEDAASDNQPTEDNASDANGTAPGSTERSSPEAERTRKGDDDADTAPSGTGK